jgi:transcriptional regulator with XRE-family HTH domain
MSSIGSRLRQERERLGHSQSELAELGSTTRKTQFNYETDARRPDADYLAAIAAVGVDVLLVLTGSSEGVPPTPLTVEEQELLDHFRKAPDAVRRAAMGALMSASPSQAATPRRNRR